jgi:hypothetical protein
MITELLASLGLLALIDSTSFGTLLIPVWLMLVPGRPRPGRIILFLGTVAAFYFLLGIALLLGASILLGTLQETGRTQPLRIAQLIVGIGLMALGAVTTPRTKVGKERRVHRRAEQRVRGGASLLVRMRGHASDASAPLAAVFVFALMAASIEAASMIPYLAAIGFLSTSELSFLGRSLVLFAYCLVMITPALLLLVARLFLHGYASPILAKLEAALSRNANEAMAWVLFLVGLYLAGDSLSTLIQH